MSSHFISMLQTNISQLLKVFSAHCLISWTLQDVCKKHCKNLTQIKEKQSKTGWRISNVGLIICDIICEKESNGWHIWWANICHQDATNESNWKLNICLATCKTTKDIRGYLASKPRACVFRQKSFKASVQRERTIQVSDQHVCFQRPVTWKGHLHKNPTSIYAVCGTTWILSNRYAIHCHQIFHLTNVQNYKEKIKTLALCQNTARLQLVKWMNVSFCFTGKCPIKLPLFSKFFCDRGDLCCDLLVWLLEDAVTSHILSTWVSLGYLGYQVFHINRSSGNKKKWA